MFDTDKLIQLIEENRSVWDETVKEYSDKRAREKSWVIIGGAMFDNWKGMSVSEKQLQGKFLHVSVNCGNITVDYLIANSFYSY